MSLLICWILTLICAACPFVDVINFCNILYSAICLIEIASFLYLRHQFPMLNRPYRVPIKGFKTLCVLMIPFIACSLVIMFGPLFYGQWIAFTSACGCILFGFLSYFILDYLRDKKIATFARLPPQALGKRWSNICGQRPLASVVGGSSQVVTDEQALSDI